MDYIVPKDSYEKTYTAENWSSTSGESQDSSVTSG